MPFRYQCFECDHVFYAYEPQVLCPECSQLGTLEMEPVDPAREELLRDLNSNCFHCGGYIHGEDDPGGPIEMIEYVKGQRYADAPVTYNPGRSDGDPRICRRCIEGRPRR